MTNEPPALCHRTTTCRLLPGSRERAIDLARIAGANRFIWNYFLAEHRALHEACQETGEKTPFPTYERFCLAFTLLRNDTPWLQTLPYGAVRYKLKYLANSWKQAIKGNAGFPRFQAKGQNESFTIPEDVKVKDGMLYIPRVGWIPLKRRGKDPYEGNRPVKAVVRKEGGRWMAHITYEVPTETRVDDGKTLGADRNAGQTTDSEGEIHRIPEMKKLKAKKKRNQRKLKGQKDGSKRKKKTRGRIAKADRKIARKRHNANHHISKKMASKANTIVLEDLKTQGMTRSAKGTVENPGTRVKQQSGRNRVILETGWAQSAQMLQYKAGEVIKVPPHYTSQQCHACGHTSAENRKTTATFRCAECSITGNAHHNAALNVLAAGLAATGRREALALKGHFNDPSNGVADPLADSAT